MEEIKIKDSGIKWIGNIPGNWNIKRLKYCVRKKITDGPHETPVFVDDGVIFLSVDSIQDGKIVFENTNCPSNIENVTKARAVYMNPITKPVIKPISLHFFKPIKHPISILKPFMTWFIGEIAFSGI